MPWDMEELRLTEYILMCYDLELKNEAAKAANS
jgi:hypothetical protein